MKITVGQLKQLIQESVNEANEEIDHIKKKSKKMSGMKDCVLNLHINLDDHKKLQEIKELFVKLYSASKNGKNEEVQELIDQINQVGQRGNIRETKNKKLFGKQNKLDVNKDGKLTSADFKLLRNQKRNKD